jgi:hypothetical protein
MIKHRPVDRRHEAAGQLGGFSLSWRASAPQTAYLPQELFFRHRLVWPPRWRVAAGNFVHILDDFTLQSISPRGARDGRNFGRKNKAVPSTPPRSALQPIRIKIGIQLYRNPNEATRRLPSYWPNWNGCSGKAAMCPIRVFCAAGETNS